MPIMKCEVEGEPGWKYGEAGNCYTYTAGNEESSREARRKAEMQMHAIKANESVNLRELVQSDLTIQVDEEAGIIRGVKVLGLTSLNGRRYAEAAIQKAVPLYEGRVVNANHPPRDNFNRSIDDRLGWLSNVRVSEGLVGDLNLLKSDPRSPKIFEAARRNPSVFGLSHNIEGKVKDTPQGAVVEEIVRVHSVDVVGDPATTKSLFESEGETMSNSEEKAKQEADAEAKAKADAEAKIKADADAKAATDAAAAQKPTVESLQTELSALKAREGARELLEDAGFKSPQKVWVNALALLESAEDRKAFVESLPRPAVKARSGAPLPSGDTSDRKIPEFKDAREFASFLRE